MSGEVEALTEALYADGELGPGYMFRDDCEHLARRFLASPWLAARVASAAADREAVERVRALADEWENCGCRPICWHRSRYGAADIDRLRAALSVPTEAEGAS